MPSVSPWSATVALVSLLVVLPGCSRGEGAGGGDAGASSPPAASAVAHASCDRVSAMSVCSEYAPAQVSASGAVLAAQCTKLGGAYVAAPCPNTAVLGSCTIGTGEVRVYYGSGAVAYDAGRATKDCTATYRGKWKPFE